MNKYLKKVKLLFLSAWMLQMHCMDQYNNLCMLAHQAIQNDQLQAALMLYQKSISLDSSDSNLYYNCGYLCTRLNDNAQAITHYQETLRLAQGNSHAKLGLSKALLACGLLEQGWPLFEHRFPDPAVIQGAFGYLTISPDSCSGKKILLRSEWGLGDMMHFVRYAKLLHEKGAHVIVQAFDPLVPLFSLCPYINRVIGISDPIPDNDVQIPMMSLPLIFNTTTQTIPAPIPYLYAQKELIDYWQKKTEHDHNYKIGICWHAKPIYLEDHSTTRRSIPLALFVPLMQMPLSLYSLQKEFGMEEIYAIPTLHCMPSDFDQTNGRFMDTAALIMNMDLVISADTSIVHIAGALGKEVWVLLPYAPEWRWLPGVAGYETHTPWYPNMRLFRQKNPGDWQAVINELIIALKEKLKEENLCSSKKI